MDVPSPSFTHPQERRRRSRPRLRGLAVVAAPLLAAWMVYQLGLRDKRQEVDAVWAAHPDLKAFLAFQPPPTNPSALRLEELARALDLNLVPRLSKAQHPREQEAKALKAVSPYLKRQYGRERRDLEPLPQDLDAWLAAHRSQLDAVALHLAASPPPVWSLPEDITAELSGDNLWTRFRFNKLLVVAALDQLRRGADQRALRLARASWQLDGGLADRSDVAGCLIGLAADRNVLLVLLEAPEVSREWVDELRRRDYLTCFRRAQTIESRVLSTSGRDFAHYIGLDTSAAWRAGLGALFIPYFTHVGLDSAQRQLGLVAVLDHVDFCKETPDSVEARYRATLPEWNRSSAFLSNRAQAWGRVQRFALERDLLVKTIELRAQRAELGHWPETLADGVPPTSCPERAWDYRVEADGAAVIELSGEPPWQPATGSVLPLAARLR